MNYYIVTQGTKSQDYSLVIKNSEILKTDDNERNVIHSLIQTTEERGTIISSRNSQSKITKHNNNYLIEVLTTNTDRLNRRIPVELLIESFSKNTFANKHLDDLYLILVTEEVEVDESNLKNIIFQIDSALRRYRKARYLKIATVILIATIVTVATVKLFSNRSVNRDRIEEISENIK